jgi:hypothetical protein
MKPLCHKGLRPNCPHFMHSALHIHALRLGLWNRRGAREGGWGRFSPIHHPVENNQPHMTPPPVPMSPHPSTNEPATQHLPICHPIHTHSEPFSAPIYVFCSPHTFHPSIAPISAPVMSERHSAGAPLFPPSYPSEPCWIRVSKNQKNYLQSIDLGTTPVGVWGWRGVSALRTLTTEDSAEPLLQPCPMAYLA